MGEYLNESERKGGGGGRMWIGFIWLRIGNIGGLF
jgi:hypothetical protein